MEILLVLAVFAALGAGLGVGWFWARLQPDSQPSTTDDVSRAVNEAIGVVRAERNDAMQAAVDTVLSVASSKLGDQLAAGKMVIDRERESVSHQVETVNTELQRVGALVSALQTESAQQSGQLTTGLEQAVRVTSTLANSTQSLERALASPKARGQWGERMAEDVLRVAGFVEGVNYRKQKKAEGGGIPDYTFLLPHGHAVHMDVKFPIDNYRRWLDAEDDVTRQGLAKQFQRDVRQRVRELSDRSYIDPQTTVDYVLLFVPNESVYGFLHEHDDAIIDVAIGQKVVLCSPTTLFAVLAVIRQSVDNFLVERRSDEILSALSGLREQWERWKEPMEKMSRGLCSAQKAFDELSGPRTRQFERQLEKLETVRDVRSLAEADGTGPAAPDLATSGGADNDDDTASAVVDHGLEEADEPIDAPVPRRSSGGQLSLRSVG